MLKSNYRAYYDTFYNQNPILMHKCAQAFADAILSGRKCALIR